MNPAATVSRLLKSDSAVDHILNNASTQQRKKFNHMLHETHYQNVPDSFLVNGTSNNNVVEGQESYLTTCNNGRPATATPSFQVGGQVGNTISAPTASSLPPLVNDSQENAISSSVHQYKGSTLSGGYSTTSGVFAPTTSSTINSAFCSSSQNSPSSLAQSCSIMSQATSVSLNSNNSGNNGIDSTSGQGNSFSKPESSPSTLNPSLLNSPTTEHDGSMNLNQKDSEVQKFLAKTGERASCRRRLAERRQLSRQIRTVCLISEKDEGLGFNIVGGSCPQSQNYSHQESNGMETKEQRLDGIFISFVLPGSVADKQGHLRRGDQIVCVNNIDLRHASHDEAAIALKSSCYSTTHSLSPVKTSQPCKVYLKVQYRPEDYERYEAWLHEWQQALTAVSNAASVISSKDLTIHSNVTDGSFSGTLLRTSPKRSLYVRALFTYDPSKDDGLPSKGLAFSIGDVLHVTNASDDEWWQARHVLIFESSSHVYLEDKVPDPHVLGGPPSDVSFDPDSHLTFGPIGIIPSKSRYERKQEKKNRRLQFKSGGGVDGVLIDGATINSYNSTGALTSVGVIHPTNQTQFELSNNPSRNRRKKKDKEQERRKRGQSASSSSSSMLSFSRKFPFIMKSRDKLNKTDEEFNNNSSSTLKNRHLPSALSSSAISSSNLSSANRILSYETVIEVDLEYTRPLIILGHLKDRFNDDLLKQSPDKFGSCVPHTTRPLRENEVDGREYHFVSSIKQMESDIEDYKFIEAGQYNGNLYGTAIQSVLDVAKTDHHCILDVSANAIKRLKLASLHPIVIYVRPVNVETMREFNRRITPEQALRMYKKIVEIGDNAEYARHFTATIESGMETPEETFAKVREVIDANASLDTVWVEASANTAVG